MLSEMSMAQRRFLEAEEGEEEFFDSREVMSPASISSPGGSGRHGALPEVNSGGWAPGDERFEVWVNDPRSVHERRERFIRSLGLLDLSAGAAVPCAPGHAAGELLPGSPRGELLPVGSSGVRREEDGVVPSTSGSESMLSVSDDCVAGEGLECAIKNLDDGTVFVIDELGKDGSFRSLRERQSNRTVSVAEFDRTFGPSPFIRELMRRASDSDEPSSPVKVVGRRRRFGWLRRLGIGACVVDMQDDDETASTSSGSCHSCGEKANRVNVRLYKKRSKELSAVYKGQEIKAHDGSIVVMKFSSDGQYLATGGDDRVVRVWRVVEGERPRESDFVRDDPSCVFFTVNENSELAPIHSNEGNKGKHKSSKKATDPACVLIPHRAFRLSSEPVHEFRGHDDVVLDLSWSTNKNLLSSSMDKTVRLWQVGCNSCLKVFSHSNYVTCIQFKPTDDNYFISGSIDGIVRIWDVPRCQVVDWADSKEIVTAVCYSPDAKGAVVGTITGNCRFYDASDDHLEMESQVSQNGRKKSPLKRITGFQYCPSDPRKLMVTSADSQVRILDGAHVASNYKGLRSSSQVAASFTPDGQHIISASDDSNVYMWNYANQFAPVANRVKTIWSYERFFCKNVSIAIPWNASQTRNSISLASSIPSLRPHASRDTCSAQENASCCCPQDLLDGDSIYQLPSGNFTLSRAFFAESAPRGSATWPEEKLPSNLVAASTLRKSQYKFLKTSCQNAATHAWGQVIVTAGWDGHIRSFQNYGLPVQL